jgi:hypothetical protein
MGKETILQRQTTRFQEVTDLQEQEATVEAFKMMKKKSMRILQDQKV